MTTPAGPVGPDTQRVESPRSVPGERASGVWSDAEELDADWAEPKPVRHRPLWLTAGVPVVVVVLLIALVWSLGGFEMRQNALALQEPGTIVESGPFEYVFTGATAKPTYDEDGWDVVVHGSGRVLGDETERPRAGENGPFVARDPKTREVQYPLSPEVGEPPEEGGRADGTNFTPGLPMVPLKLSMEFGAEYEPTATLTFVVLQQEFTDNTLTGTGEKTWNNASEGVVLDLPVTVLPADG